MSLAIETLRLNQIHKKSLGAECLDLKSFFGRVDFLERFFLDLSSRLLLHLHPFLESWGLMLSGLHLDCLRATLGWLLLAYNLGMVDGDRASPTRTGLVCKFRRRWKFFCRSAEGRLSVCLRHPLAHF